MRFASRHAAPAAAVVRMAGLAALLSIGLRGSQQPEAGLFELEVPELGVQARGGGTVVLPRLDVSGFEIRIRRTGLDFGAIHSKINAEAADIIMTSLARRDEIVCRFDLTFRGGFRFNPGLNSVEISFEDRRGRLSYTSFLVTDQGRPAYRSDSPRPSARAPKEKYAVVVGISKYANHSTQVEDLEYAARDAAAVKDFLVSSAGGGLDQDHIFFLKDEEATLKNIRTALFTFLTKPREEDQVLIYFAGHGMADPNDPRQLYLLAHDSEFDNMGGTALPMSDFQSVFERILKSQWVVTFADACHSRGISGALLGGSPEQNNLINQYLARASQSRQRAVITASDISELSFESGDWGNGHGVFTYYLLEGLRGKADLDKDGTVVAGEVFEFVQSEVRKATAGNQNPSVVGGLADSLALARVGGAKRAAMTPLQRLIDLPNAMSLLQPLRFPVSPFWGDRDNR